MAASDTDNHVLLFKHSVVETQQSPNAEESYVPNEVGNTAAICAALVKMDCATGYNARIDARGSQIPGILRNYLPTRWLRPRS